MREPADLRRRQQLAAHGFTVAFVVIWAIYAARIPTYVLPSPWKVVESLTGFFTNYTLFRHAWISIFHALSGIFIAFALGFGLSVAAYYLPTLRFAVYRRITPAFNAFPGIGKIMLAVLWLGINDITVIFSITTILLPFVLINMQEGMRDLNAERIEMARSFSRRAWRQFALVVLPSLYPFMFATLRICFGVAWKVTLTAELFGGRDGLGYLFDHARQEFDTALIFSIIVIIIAFVYATDRWIFEGVQRRLERHHAFN